MLPVAKAGADELRFFQLGTGRIGETRFAIGGLIANALSNPPGSRPCEKGGSCGVPGLVAVATATGGSADDIEAVAQHRLDAALVDADVATWAIHGGGPFKGHPLANLRGIAVVYPQSLHLVVRHDSAIHGPAGLRGKRLVVAGSRGAATRGKQLLGAWGLAEGAATVQALPLDAAAQALAAGKADALLVTDAWPVPELAALVRSTPVDLLPLDGEPAERLIKEHPYFLRGSIPAAAYQGMAQPVPTLEVGAVLVTSAEADPALVAGITRALWHPSTQKLLAEGNPHGSLVKLDAEALKPLGLAVHPGAVAAY